MFSVHFLLIRGCVRLTTTVGFPWQPPMSCVGPAFQASRHSALLSTASQYCFSVLLLSTSQRYFSTFQFSVLLFRTQRFSALFLNLAVSAGHGHGLGINLSALLQCELLWPTSMFVIQWLVYYPKLVQGGVIGRRSKSDERSTVHYFSSLHLCAD